VAVLFLEFGSEVFEVTVALSVIILPDDALTLTTRLIFSEVPLAIVPTVQVTLPVPPTGGAVQLPCSE